MHAPCNHTHPQQPCTPPATTHAPQQPCMPHPHIEQPHTPPATMHAPLTTTHPPVTMHDPSVTMRDAPATTHAPLQPHTPPGNHTCPPSNCTHPPWNHALPQATMHAPCNHACPPSLWTEFLTHASENINLPQTSFAGGNKQTQLTGRSKTIRGCRPFHTKRKQKRKWTRSKNKQKRSKNKRQTPKEIFAFTFAFSHCEWILRPKVTSNYSVIRQPSMRILISGKFVTFFTHFDHYALIHKKFVCSKFHLVKHRTLNVLFTWSASHAECFVHKERSVVQLQLQLRRSTTIPLSLRHRGHWPSGRGDANPVFCQQFWKTKRKIGPGAGMPLPSMLCS